MTSVMPSSPGPDLGPTVPRASRTPRTPNREGVRRSRLRRLRVPALLLVLFMIPVGWSYGGYLTAAGHDPVSVRSVDWLRDHGFDSAVNHVEQWWYTRHRPTGSAPATADLPSEGARTPGVWHDVAGLDVPGAFVQQSYVLPDPRFPSVAVALVRLDQHAVKTVYVPGLKEPGGSFNWGGEVPTAQRPELIAAFNAGFRMRHITGGAWTEGRVAGHPLENGQASAVIYRDGHTVIGQWGRDVSMTSDVVSVRQNLDLIVDGGLPVPGLVTDHANRWGTTHSQLQYTWRSGLGIDSHGRLIYAAGREMSLTQLAQALSDAGAERAMQLDIHDNVVTYNWFRRQGSTVTGSRLMTSMTRSADRFLAPDSRDFFAIEAR